MEEWGVEDAGVFKASVCVRRFVVIKGFVYWGCRGSGCSRSGSRGVGLFLFTEDFEGRHKVHSPF